MEGGAGCYLYPCGAAAVTNSILSFVKTGDHVLMSGAAYEPTQDFCNIVLKKMQIDTTYYDPLIGADIATLFNLYKSTFLGSTEFYHNGNSGYSDYCEGCKKGEP